MELKLPPPHRLLKVMAASAGWKGDGRRRRIVTKIRSTVVELPHVGVFQLAELFSAFDFFWKRFKLSIFLVMEMI
jgi:hypothetical protein